MDSSKKRKPNLPDLNSPPPSPSPSPSSSPTLPPLLQDMPKNLPNTPKCAIFDLNTLPHDDPPSLPSHPPAASTGFLESNSQQKSLLAVKEQTRSILRVVVSGNLDPKLAAIRLKHVLHITDPTMDILRDFNSKKIDLSLLLKHLKGALTLSSFINGETNIEMKKARLKDLLTCPTFGKAIAHDHTEIMEIIGAKDQVMEIVERLVAEKNVTTAESACSRISGMQEEIIDSD